VNAAPGALRDCLVAWLDGCNVFPIKFFLNKIENKIGPNLIYFFSDKLYIWVINAFHHKCSSSINKKDVSISACFSFTDKILATKKIMNPELYSVWFNHYVLYLT
jgi:hypothetical protein